MLKFTLIDGARLEVPPSSVRIIEERFEEGEERGTTVAFDLGGGMQNEPLSDKYGFVKKQVIDAGGLHNPLEVTIITTEKENHRVTFSRNIIVARRELLDHELGIKSLLSLNFGAGISNIGTADTLDQMDGIESRASTPAPPRPRKSKE